MLCEKCNKNIANVHLKNNINGAMSESHLCSACAGEIYGQSPMNLFEGEFVSDILGMLNLGKLAAPTGAARQNNKCPMCGLSFADIAKSGKAGCGKCYETFKDEFGPSVLKIHGTARHTGKIPKNLSSRLYAKRRTEELKARLGQLVAEQNFEEAALVRDELKQLNSENQVENQNREGGDQI